MQTIVRTKENVEKKQALTYEEMEAEREEVSYLALILSTSTYTFRKMCSDVISSVVFFFLKLKHAPL